MNNQVEWITLRQAIELAKVSDSTIRRWIKQNKIKWQYSKSLRRYRIDKRSLIEHLAFGGDDND